MGELGSECSCQILSVTMRTQNFLGISPRGTSAVLLFSADFVQYDYNTSDDVLETDTRFSFSSFGEPRNEAKIHPCNYFLYLQYLLPSCTAAALPSMVS